MKLIQFFILFLSASVFAQTDSSSLQSEWKHSLVSGFLLTQMSYTDWAQGGENALAYTITIDGKSIRDVENTNWSNTYIIAYGQTRLGSKGLRKTDDKLEFESVLTYKMGTYVNPYASATFKSQFAEGFKYDDVAGTRVKTSDGFDPMYLTQTVGVGYQPVAQVKTRLGVGVREVLSAAQGYADDVKTTPTIETSKIEGGLESVTDVEWKFEENLLLTSKLEMFTAFNNIDLVIIRSNNTLAAKMNQYVSVNLNVQLINDANITPRTQVKQSLAIGLTYTLL